MKVYVRRDTIDMMVVGFSLSGEFSSRQTSDFTHPVALVHVWVCECCDVEFINEKLNNESEEYICRECKEIA